MAEAEMVIDSIRASMMRYEPVVTLKEKDADRYLLVQVDQAEADAIAVKLQGVTVPRPLTSDLVCAVIDALGAAVKSATISELRDGMFCAKIVLVTDGGQIEIDCRPSAALAVAMRAGAPIFADEKVLAEAGIVVNHQAR